MQLAAIEYPLQEWPEPVAAGNAESGKRYSRRPRATPAVVAGKGDPTLQDYGLDRRTLQEMLRLQGAPVTLLDESPLTINGKRRLVGNAVPMPMGLAVARAVRAAMQLDCVSGGTAAAAPTI